MNLAGLVSPLAPYKWLFVGALLLGALGYASVKGYNFGVDAQKGRDAKSLQEKDAALHTAAAALRAAGSAIEVIDAEAKRRIADAEKAERSAEAGRVLADARAAAMQANLRAYQERLAGAGARSPACRALLDQDVGAVCGL